METMQDNGAVSGRLWTAALGAAACLALSCSEPAYQATAETNTQGVEPPTLVTGPGESSSGTVTITWVPSPTQGVTYELEHRTFETGTWEIGYEGTDTSATIRIAIDGTYEIRVRACTSPSICSSWTPPQIITVTLVFPQYVQAACPGPIPVAPPAHENVGAVDGRAGVRGGAGTYSVPIVVPPGRRGMAPNVSLEYSSGASNGLPGMGWSLVAASSIARCGRTPAQDGTTQTIDFTTSDRLCLDGTRLVLTSGQYGGSGSTYRAETDGFDRVTLHGDIQSLNAGAGAWFEVEHKSGRRSLYGAFDGRSDATEILTDAPAPSAWWIGRTLDPQGNAVDYNYRTYDEAQVDGRTLLGQHVVDSIKYTGTNSILGDREVAFEYSERIGDKSTAYHAGSMRRTTRVLSAIETSVQGNLVRRYELSHTPSRSTERSLLTQVTVCTSRPCGAATSLPPTVFAYQDEHPTFEWVDVSADELVHVRLAADHDGDGRRDIFEHEYDEPLGGAIRSELQLSGGGQLNVLNGPWWAGFERVLNGQNHWNNTDFDQDGIADILGVVASGASNYLALHSNGLTRLSDLELVNISLAEAHVGDFDGNGRSDLLWKNQSGSYVMSLQDDGGLLHFDGNPVPFPALTIRQDVKDVADYDGNGYADAYVDWNGESSPPEAGDGPMIVFSHPTTGGVTFQVEKLIDLGAAVTPTGSPPRSPRLDGTFADINGDGLPDIRGRGNRVRVNVGGSFRFAGGGPYPTDETDPADRPLQIDYNADGRSDTLLPGDVVYEWCVQLIGTGSSGYDAPYCSLGLGAGLRDFDHNEAPKHLDRTVREWKAYLYHDDGSGNFTVSVRTNTGIWAATGYPYVEDHGGDGLNDVGSHVRHLYAMIAPGTAVETGWYPPNQGLTSYGAKVARSTGGAPDLLVHAQDGLGVESRWTYAPLSARDDVDGCASPQGLPFYRVNHDAMATDHDRFHFASSMQVVAKFESTNGVGGLNPTCYRYEDALADNQGRGFLGFSKVIEEEALTDPNAPTEPDPNNLRTTTSYRLGFPYSGKPTDVRVHLASDAEDAVPLESTTHQWSANCTPSTDSSSEASYCFTYETIRQNTRRKLSSRAWISTSTTVTTYDTDDLRYGNVSAIEVRTEDSEVRHVTLTDYEYDYSDEASWWIDRLSAQTVTQQSVEYYEQPVMAVTTNPENEPKSVREDFDYHSLGNAWARLPRTTDLQKGAPQQWKKTEFKAYDAYGNLSEVEVTAADATAPRTELFTYHPGGYFELSSTNPLGHTIEYTAVDAATGEILSTKDPRQLVTTKTLDGFGRTVSVTASGKPTIHTRLRWCTACPTGGVYEEITQQDGSRTRAVVRDVLGRPIQVRETAFDPLEDVYKVLQYDARMRLVGESQPSFDPGGEFFTRYEDFDARGRVGRKVVDRTGHVDASGAPDETFVTTYVYDGLETSITLDGILTASRKHDALGRLLGTVDTAGKATTFRYDGAGNAILIRDHQGNETRAGYDSRGRKTWMDDPNRGSWRFRYDGLNLLRWQEDANGTIVEFDYDGIDRPAKRFVNGLLEGGFTYDTTHPGLLHQEEKLDGSGVTVFSRTHEYDGFARPSITTEAFDGQIYRTLNDYDCHGLLRAQEYPRGEAVEFTYDSYGQLQREANPKSIGPLSELYREILVVGARGNIESERFGNGLEGRYEFIDSTGDIVRQCVGDMADPCTDAKQDLRYGYEDPWGNLTFAEKHFHDPTRYGPLLSARESYVYDDRFRLTEAKRSWDGNGTPEVTTGYDYDDLGNLVRKDDYALTYLYGDNSRSIRNAGPHAVREVTKLSGQVVADFEYDNNGNQIVGDGREIVYTWMNKPAEIREGALTTSFQYDVNHLRYRQQGASGRITRYVGKQFEEILSGSSIEDKTYVGSNVVVTNSTGSFREVRYMHLNRLGSVETVTNVVGEVVESHDFDAFGQPRTSQWEDAGGELHSGEFLEETTTRGFTGHEHLDDHRLIHMNGRAYDPVMGRFLSVDPFIVDPLNLQALNPYSYVLNNPMAATDPSGYWLESAIDIASIAAGVHSVSNWDESTSGLDKALDVGGLVVDAAALLLPVLPGVAGLSLKAARTADRVADGFDSATDVARGIDKAADAAGDAKTFDKVGDAAESGSKAQGTGAKGADAGKQNPADVGSPSSTGKTDASGGCAGGKCDGTTGTCFVAGTPVHVPGGTRSIEAIQVGDRVLTYQGESATRVDATWRIVALDLEMEGTEGESLEVILLRPHQWLLDRSIAGPGARVYLEPEEIDVAGWATVTAVRPSPRLDAGPGRIVLATMRHRNAKVRSLSFEGGGVLYPTDLHKLFSADRGDWVRARDLRVGERLQTARGAVAIAALERLRGGHEVFNLEVEGDHEFLVGPLAVRAHNEGCGDGARKGPEPNEGVAKPHGNPEHNAAIDGRIDELKKDPGVSNVRKNQQQVDVDGNKVGTNRPDVQYDKDGCHHCVEYDHSASRSERHGETIRRNDPNAKVELNKL